MSEPVFKICPALALQEARKRERYEGSAADARDGFIHLSAGHLVARTLAKYFAGQNDLALLAIDPHVISIETLKLQEDGSHCLSTGIAP